MMSGYKDPLPATIVCEKCKAVIKSAHAQPFYDFSHVGLFVECHGQRADIRMRLDPRLRSPVVEGTAFGDQLFAVKVVSA